MLLWALQVSNSEMSNFSQDQVSDPALFAGETCSFIRLWRVDAEIAQKGHLWMETRWYQP